MKKALTVILCLALVFAPLALLATAKGGHFTFETPETLSFTDLVVNKPITGDHSALYTNVTALKAGGGGMNMSSYIFAEPVEGNLYRITRDCPIQDPSNGYNVVGWQNFQIPTNGFILVTHSSSAVNTASEIVANSNVNGLNKGKAMDVKTGMYIQIPSGLNLTEAATISGQTEFIISKNDPRSGNSSVSETSSEPARDPIHAFVVKLNEKISNGDQTVFTKEFNGTNTIKSSEGNFRWVKLLICKPTAEANVYELVEAKQNLTTDPDQSITLPEGGIAIVSHFDDRKVDESNPDSAYLDGGKSKDNMAAIGQFVVGDKIKLSGVDFTAKTVAANAAIDLVVSSGNTSDTSSNTSSVDPSELLGTPKENPNAVVTVKGPATYTAGQKINVTVTLESIKNTDGVGTVEFILSYDKNLLSADITDLNECEKKFATKLPNTDDWELMATSFEEGRYELSLLGTGTEGLKDSSKFEMTIPFTVKANATGALNIYVRHDEVSAKDMEYTALVVNGSLLTITKHVHTPGEWEITRAATKTVKGLKVKKCTVCGEVLETVEFDYDAPITGDAGVIALSILAVVAIAGTAIVIRKRG